MPKQKTIKLSEEAVQGDGHGEAPAPSRDEEPQPREEVRQAKARRSATTRPVASSDVPEVNKLLGRGS